MSTDKLIERFADMKARKIKMNSQFGQEMTYCNNAIEPVTERSDDLNLVTEKLIRSINTVIKIIYIGFRLLGGMT